MAYSGPRHDVGSTFSAQGFDIPEFFNPADFLLDIISIDYRPECEKATRERVDGIVTYWAEREKSSLNEKETRPLLVENSDSVHEESRITPMWIALPTVLERSIRNLWRQQPGWYPMQYLVFNGLILL